MGFIYHISCTHTHPITPHLYTNIHTSLQILLEFMNSKQKDHMILNYDNRARQTDIELNKAAALFMIEDMQEKLATLSLSPSLMSTPLAIQHIADSKTLEIMTVDSNLFRELIFASHHAVHHLSMIKLMINALGTKQNHEQLNDIGMATSTTVYKNQQQQQQHINDRIRDLGINKCVKTVEDKYWIAPNSMVVGEVELDENVSVWFNTIIRGDAEKIIIGKNSQVQDNCVLHADEGYPLMIGRDVSIGHSCCIHGCEIQNGSLIGIGSTVLNGVKIGKYRSKQKKNL